MMRVRRVALYLSVRARLKNLKNYWMDCHFNILNPREFFNKKIFLPSSDFGDPMTLPLAPPKSQNVWFVFNVSGQLLMNCLEICAA